MKFSHFAMGTTFEIFIAGQKETYARQAAVAVFEKIDRLESILSRFDSRSDVGQLSRLKPGQSLSVGIELIECLIIAAEVYTCTNGAFDVTLGPLMKSQEEEGVKSLSNEASSWIGFNRFNFATNGAVFFNAQPADHEGAPSPEKNEIKQKITIVGDPDSTPTDSGSLKLDFGGIGKGYALDKILDVLEDWDIDRALIHGGTSTALAIGDSPENSSGKKGWSVGTAGDTIYLHNMALSGSGKEVKGEHILDPRTGEPAAGHLSAWVAHPSAAVADALSTAFIVMRPEEAADFCRDNPHVWAKVEEYPGAVKTYNPKNLLRFLQEQEIS